MSIETALILAQGFGTRFLPITKSIQKEMLPLLDRPVIDYVIEDCLKAGVKRVIVAVKPGEVQIRNYYTPQADFRAYLRQKGALAKLELLDVVEQRGQAVSFIEVDPLKQYGTAVPVLAARELLQSEPAFLVITGDELLYQPDGQSAVQGLIDLWQLTHAPVITGLSVDPNLIDRYGIIDTVEKDGILYLKSLVEKPAIGSVSSHLANLSKYILTANILPLIAHQEADSRSGELYLTDSISLLAEISPVAVYSPEQAVYLDCGNPESWLKANQYLAQQQAGPL